MNIRRILAYLFDIVAISLIAGSLAMSPLNPNYHKTESLREEYEEITEEYQNQFEELDTEEEQEELLKEFREISKGYSLKISKLSIYDEAISLSCIVLYFVVFAYFFDGQTVGKRLMKIRITTKEGKRVTLGKLLVRITLLFELPFKILTMILAFVCTQDSFYDLYNIIYYLTIVFDVTLICTALGRLDRRGLHDFVAGTKVTIDSENISETVMTEKEK